MSFTANELTRAGDFYYFPGGMNNAPSIPGQDLAGSNQSAIRSILDGLNFTSVGFIRDFQANHTLENETVTVVDNCGVGEIDRSVEKIAQASFTWVSTGNLLAFADMFGLNLTNVVGSVQNVTGETTTAWDLGVPFLLANPYNVDAGTIVVAETAGPTTLVLGTDYEVLVQGGRTYIVPITAQTLADIEIAYDYTVYEGAITGYNYEKTSVPYGLYKFVSCPIPFVDGGNNYARTWTYYFVKHFPNEALTQAFVNLTTNEIEGSPVSLQGALGGQVLFYYEDVQI